MRTCRVMFSGASRGMVYLSDTRSPIMRGSQITSQLEVSKIEHFSIESWKSSGFALVLLHSTL